MSTDQTAKTKRRFSLGGWAFTGGEYVDHAHGWRYLSAGYEATDPGYEDRHSIPVLWDTETHQPRPSASTNSAATTTVRTR